MTEYFRTLVAANVCVFLLLLCTKRNCPTVSTTKLGMTMAMKNPIKNFSTMCSKERELVNERNFIGLWHISKSDGRNWENALIWLNLKISRDFWVFVMTDHERPWFDFVPNVSQIAPNVIIKNSGPPNSTSCQSPSDGVRLIRNVVWPATSNKS